MTTAINTAELTSSALDRVFPASYCRTESSWVSWLSLVALILLPTTILISEDATRLSIYILLLTKFLSWKYVARSIQSNWLYWMALAFFIYMLLAVVYASYNFTIPFSEHWQFTERCIFLFGFLLVGWWMGDSDKSLTTFIYLIYFGLVLGLIKYSSSADWSNAIEFKRVGFGRHPEHISLWFGSGLMLAAYQISQRFKSQSLSITILLMEAGFLVLFLFVFAAGQTRAAWLGLLAGVTLTGLLMLFFRRKSNTLIKYRLIFGSSVIIASLILFLTLINLSDGLKAKIELDIEQSVLFVKGDERAQ